MEEASRMRKQDAWGQPILKVGDVVRTHVVHQDNDPGTVVKILQVNANGAYVVAVKWFTWDNGRTTEEYVSELELMSEV
jgi:hypothetical protein